MSNPGSAPPTGRIYELHVSRPGPLVATAIHDGHDVRPDLLSLMVLDDAGRLREEDPFTGKWTAVGHTRVIATRSRFEVDLNRPRETCTYRKPEDCWGLELYRQEPKDVDLERSVAQYDDFYRGMHALLSETVRRHGFFVLFDLHSYNHRRLGPEGPEADPAENPQVNVGSGTMDRSRWGSVVDTFIGALSAHEFPAGKLDVRENVKFRGGQLSRWVHETFPTTGVAIAIELKKFFMDEWSGEPDHGLVDAIGAALDSTTEAVVAAAAAVVHGTGADTVVGERHT